MKMIRIGQLKLKPDHTKNELEKKILTTLKISKDQMIHYQIIKQSLDARKKPELFYVYTVDVSVKNEHAILKKCNKNQVRQINEKTYQFEISGVETMENRPVIIGSGPAGLFCAYILAEHGYCPVVFERGASVEQRQKEIALFWETGILNPESNVQFGEGGAGTFSDGKLNTLVKDSFGRNQKVLQIFVDNGAPKEILYMNKPHIGTDILIHVIRNMRKKIENWGGEIQFHSKFVDFDWSDGKIKSVQIEKNGKIQTYSTEMLILAIGHSARDTFEMLYQKEIHMEPKAFAVGVRVEHKQSMINESQYGQDSPYRLPAASYKLTMQTEKGQGVYTFCMCPGGYVVNASSEEGRLAVNGMSYSDRAGDNANSAVIVTISPEDYGNCHPLSGVEFQRRLEEKAYTLGNGKIPVQRFEDFCNRRPSDHFGSIVPQMKGQCQFADVREIFPKNIGNALEEGIKSFDKQIHGFANPDTLLSGVESRTSSPVRICRNEACQIEKTGIYPCGEGAGYAGGITSAAMDGLKIAEQIAKQYTNFDKKQRERFRKI